MKTRTTFLAGAVVALCAVLPVLSGCDKAGETVAAASPASPAEAAEKLRGQIAQGHFAEAGAEGERYLKDKQDQGGAVAWETAKAYAQAGKANEAVRYAELALRGGAVQAVALMSEPLLEPVRTDPRLVALAAGGEQANPPVAAPGASAGDGVEANADAGTAKAGDVSVKLPD